MKKIGFSALLALVTLAGCGDGGEKEAQIRLQKAEAALQQENFSEAKLQIDKNITNNLTISQFIEKYGNIVLGYLDESSDTLQENFQSFFNILNGLGYWSDKKRNGTNINRVYDANHAFYASSCDYFVTNDKKAMMKANFIYSYYGIKTKSISFDEFLNILSSNK